MCPEIFSQAGRNLSATREENRLPGRNGKDRMIAKGINGALLGTT
jgi:hypothetical protein